MYFLTTDLEIIYYPDNQFSQSKLFDLSQKQFVPYIGNFQPVGQIIIGNEGMAACVDYFTSKKAQQLSAPEMKWVENFQSLLLSDANILEDTSLSYNYFSSALQILGFDKDFVKRYLQNYFLQEKRDSEGIVKNRVRFYRKISSLLKEKTYFHLEDLQTETKQEMRAICAVLERKHELNYNFNYLEHGKPIIMDVMEQSRIPKILKFHLTKSYWITKQMDSNLLTNYILQEMEDYIKEIMEKQVPYYGIEPNFANNIQKEILGTIKMYLTVKLKYQG